MRLTDYSSACDESEADRILVTALIRNVYNVLTSAEAQRQPHQRHEQVVPWQVGSSVCQSAYRLLEAVEDWQMQRKIPHAGHAPVSASATVCDLTTVLLTVQSDLRRLLIEGDVKATASSIQSTIDMLEGNDPWEGCEDVAIEDLFEWFADALSSPEPTPAHGTVGTASSSEECTNVNMTLDQSEDLDLDCVATSAILNKCFELQAADDEDDELNIYVRSLHRELQAEQRMSRSSALLNKCFELLPDDEEERMLKEKERPSTISTVSTAASSSGPTPRTSNASASGRSASPVPLSRPVTLSGPRRFVSSPLDSSRPLPAMPTLVPKSHGLRRVQSQKQLRMIPTCPKVVHTSDNAESNSSVANCADQEVPLDAWEEEFLRKMSTS